MKRKAYLLGALAACLLWTPAVFGQARAGQKSGPRSHVQPASYCRDCGGHPDVLYGAGGGPLCDGCGIPAWQPCGCGSLVRELVCDVKMLVDASVGRVVRCLLPAGLCCDPCAPPPCEPLCAGCGTGMPDYIGPTPMIEPMPGPRFQDRGDPFRDDPAENAYRPYPRSNRSYSPTAARSGSGARQASYDAPAGGSPSSRYRPPHRSQFRRSPQAGQSGTRPRSYNGSAAY